MRTPCARLLGVAAVVVCHGLALASHDPEEDASVPAPEAETREAEVIEVEEEAPLDPGTASERVLVGETLALTPRRSADDLLRLVPGLVISQHGAEGKAQQFFLRGFDAVHGSDLQVLVAGIPVNEPSNVHGHGYVDIGFVIPEVVRALHAHKGSFDLAQGNFATAGSVEMELGVPHGGRGHRVLYEVGTTNRHRLLLVEAPADLPEASFAALELVTDDGYGTNRHARRATGVVQHRLGLGRWGRFVELLAVGHAASFGEPGVVPLADVENGRLGFYETYDDDSEGRSERVLVGARLRDEADGRGLDLRVHAGWRRLALMENFTGYLLYPEMGDRRRQRHRALTGGGRLSLVRSVTPRVQAVGGADLRVDSLVQDEHQVDAAGAPWMENRSLEGEQIAGGVWAGARFRPVDGVTVEGGARLDLVHLRADDLVDDLSGARTLAAVSPRASASARVPPDWTGFAAAGRGVRSPEARSVTRSGEPPPDVDTSEFDGGDPRITVSDAVELGARGFLGDAVTVGLTGFGIWIANEMVFDHVSGVNVARNATRRLGAELGVEARLLPWVSLRGDVTAVDARFVDSGAPVPGAPRLLGTGEARARHGRWRAGAQLVAIAPRPLAHGATGAPITVVNLLGGVRLGRFDIDLQIDNVFDARWREGEYHFASRFSLDEPPSMLPKLHYSAGRPLGVRLAVGATF